MKIKGIKRIKDFIRRQRQIGENEFAQRMIKRYNKTAKEFYDQFADQVFYINKDGEKIGLDIQTLWYFRTNEMLREMSNKPILVLNTEHISSSDLVAFKEAWLHQSKNVIVVDSVPKIEKTPFQSLVEKIELRTLDNIIPLGSYERKSHKRKSSREI